MLPLLLLASLPAPTSPAPVQTHDLGRLTFRQAEALSGQLVCVTFVVDGGLADDGEGGLLVDAEGEPGTSRTVWYVSGVQTGIRRAGQRLTVEGVMRTRIVPARLIDG